MSEITTHGGRYSQTTIVVDTENNGEQWWEAARAAGKSAPAPVRRLLAGPYDEVTCSPADAREVLAWAQTLPGWNDGPDYARHPILFRADDGESMLVEDPGQG